MCYLKHTISLGLHFPASNALDLTIYSNVDSASYHLDQKSVSGFYVFLGGVPISWKSKKQVTVATSFAKVEYKSMAFAAQELLWVLYVLKYLMVDVELSIPICCDNKYALLITTNSCQHGHTKHVKEDVHFV